MPPSIPWERTATLWGIMQYGCIVSGEEGNILNQCFHPQCLQSPAFVKLSR